MRSCDGIFSVNWVGALWAQQEIRQSGAKPDPLPDTQPCGESHGCATKKARPVFAARSQTFFGGGAKFIRQPLDNTCAASSEKNEKVFRRAEDIHRSGGKLLDNLGLT